MFILRPETRIVVETGDQGLARVGRYLRYLLRRPTGYRLPLTGAPLRAGDLVLRSESGHGDEGYRLTVTPGLVTIAVSRPGGAFYGVQTLRQLLPPGIERRRPQVGSSWRVPVVTIRDRPRFAWRGTMLDVARHVFGVGAVKRLIDLAALYKLNRLHLHLSDDQGGGHGGYYTQEQYTRIVSYAQSRHVVVPEIEMPGHVGVALSSYGELSCDGIAPPLETSARAAPNSLCTTKDVTHRFVTDVVRELAALTPGPNLHIGGDEALAMGRANYACFIDRVQRIVGERRKRTVGWEEIAQAKLAPGTIVQHWHGDLTLRTIAQGAQVSMSPATRAYLDMKYKPATPLGLSWAGYTTSATHTRGIRRPRCWAQERGRLPASRLRCGPRR